jgi:hypothetical protein
MISHRLRHVFFGAKRKMLFVFGLGAIAYGNVPKGSLLEQRLDEALGQTWVEPW